MQNQLNNPSIPPKNKFANVFRLFARISYWIHLILGATSGIILGLIVFSRRLGESTNNSAIQLSIIFTVASLIVLAFRIFWAWRYSRIARQLQTTNSAMELNRAEIIKVLRVGLSVSLLGLILAFIASETTVVTIIAEAISQPQGSRLYEPEQAIQTADLFLDFVNVTILGAHALGAINSLGLLNWITRE
ncbi:MAG TPA: DUF3611 family protein [Coleofasciculaceae cyanobacterium]|jgi:hypothetical protein